MKVVGNVGAHTAMEDSGLQVFGNPGRIWGLSLLVGSNTEQSIKRLLQTLMGITLMQRKYWKLFKLQCKYLLFLE